jgi:predicted nucleic acid-binding protein
MAVSHCLDTNLLLYAFSKTPRDAAKARIARDWIKREDWGVTVQILQEFYVNAVRAPHQLGHEDALAMIEEIASSRPVATIDVPLMRHALQLKSRYRIAYWDAAVVAGARRLGAAVLVSEDLAHGQDYGGVRVLNPFVSVPICP